MVEAGQDVLDAEHGVGLRHLEGARAGGDHKTGCKWQNAAYLRRAVAALHTDQHVDAGGCQIGELDGFAGEPAIDLHSPALHRRAGGIAAARWRDHLCGGRELRAQLQGGAFVQRRQLPQHVIGGRVDLAQLQVGRAEFVRRGRPRQADAKQQEHAQAANPGAHREAADVDSVASMTTS